MVSGNVKMMRKRILQVISPNDCMTCDEISKKIGIDLSLVESSIQTLWEEDKVIQTLNDKQQIAWYRDME